MDALAQFDTVLELFAKLGVETRREHLGGEGGGLCWLRGKPVVFVDLDADIATKLSRCVHALADMPEIEAMYLPPALREQVETLRGG